MPSHHRYLKVPYVVCLGVNPTLVTWARIPTHIRVRTLIRGLPQFLQPKVV